jgi:large subunit ribosomal protein L35
MPKLKTHSSAKKRFKVTGSGKIKRPKANHNHLMRNKSGKAKLKNREYGLVSAADTPRVRAMILV